MIRQFAANILRTVSTRGAAILVFVPLMFSFCAEKKENPDPKPAKEVIRAADLSFLPEMEDDGIVFYNRSGVAEDMLLTLKNAGMNTVRIRLWHTPASSRSGFAEVQALAERAHGLGLSVWITVHYSDTWADPGQQQTPSAWQELGVQTLADSVYNYTARIVEAIKPEYIQIGNEINAGMLWPTGRVSSMTNLKALLTAGSKAVRDKSPGTRIMLHLAGTGNVSWLFGQLQSVDYDISAVSYYPFWHGKDLSVLENSLQSLAGDYLKPVVIAETAYPFSLQWNDWTNNVIGLQDQLTPEYPATPEGQRSFMMEIRRISTAMDRLTGFAYWGADWVASKGPQAANGSSWENMAVYDFSFRALPVSDCFAEEPVSGLEDLK